jgi:3-methyladenine DNA glycosylase/8-oxoguanine DNA glycosylase
VPQPVTEDSATTARESVWRPSWPVRVHGTLATLQRGGGDPTYRLERDGTVWRTCRTPLGTATLRLVTRRSDSEVVATAWGDGAEWVLAGVPELLGAHDDVAGFAPHHPRVAEAWHRHAAWRVPRTGLVLEALVPAVIEQLVTGAEAFGAWRLLLHRFGEPAPGPAADLGMRVVPTPAQWAAIASWEWLRAGVDGKRSATVMRVVRRAGRLEQTVGEPSASVDRKLQSLAGVGVWTSAEVRQRAHGDADAVSFGDYHVAKDIGWALTGAPLDDDGLAELLEPYRPHRYRVQRLLELDGARRPRRGPRLGVRTHLPVSRSRRPAR